MSGILQKLQTRALLADKLINLLKKEILELTSLINAEQKTKNIDALKSETEKLEEKVARSKEELIELQKQNGVEQVQLPNEDNKVVPAAAVDKSVETKENNDSGKNETETEKKPIHFGRLELRVGRILEINYHPDAENLYIEKIDVGEKEPRQIISGLRKHILRQDLFLRPVVCLCNLKPVKLRGEDSFGMVMCALYNDTVEPLWPPQNANPGDLLRAGHCEPEYDKELNTKENIYETVVKDLKVNEDKVLMYKDDIPVEVPQLGHVFTRKFYNCSVG